MSVLANGSKDDCEKNDETFAVSVGTFDAAAAEDALTMSVGTSKAVTASVVSALNFFFMFFLLEKNFHLDGDDLTFVVLLTSEA
jgi:hypothetical protein